MRTTTIDKITILEDRQRKTFDEKSIVDLAESIKNNGLIHAPVLDNDHQTLIAGERRYRALQLLAKQFVPIWHDGQMWGPGIVPYTTVGDLSDDQRYELELEENIQRVDLSWQERVSALARLRELHERRARASGQEFSTADMAKAVAGPDEKAITNLQALANRAARIAPHLNDPDVAKAKTQKEALNIIKRKNNDLLMEELQRRTLAEAPRQSPHTFIEGSVFDHVASLPDSTFDIILTDPPYGIDMNTMPTQSGSSSGHTHGYTDSEEYAESCVALVADTGFRITKASAVCYMFCDLRFFNSWANIFKGYGWYVWPNPIIWNKSPTGSLLGNANGPRHCYEAVLMAIKGGKGVNVVGGDVISIPGPSHDKLHPAEKPVDLYAELLRWSAVPGDRIIDFFCGCGPIFPAASRFQCRATGFELDPAHALKARDRANGGDML